MVDLQSKTGVGRRSRGLSAVEVIVLIALMGLFVMVAVMMLPRGRETARMAGCRRNLMQIGAAMALYDQAQQSLPLVPPPDDARGATGPLSAMLAELGLPDFEGLEDPKNRTPKRPGPFPGGRRVPGFVCASDPHATGGLFPSPVSYRATTGDAPDGRDGAFAPGRRVGIAAIEAADGAGYTAAFSERLVGDGRDGRPEAHNYALVPGSLGEAGCPRASPDAWRGDAGSSWVTADWRSTLYNHALTPGASPSCIASDGRSAFMGASSGHEEGVNVLAFDGGVRTFTPRVDPRIWRDWAAFPQVAPQPTGSPAPPSSDAPSAHD